MHATPLRGSCGVLFYGKKVRIQDVAIGRVASFNTSFTFKTLGLPWDSYNSSSRDKDNNGVAFNPHKNLSMLLARLQAFMSEIRSASACRSPLHLGDPNHRYTPLVFLILFKNDSLELKDTCNSIIRVGKNCDYKYDNEAYTYKLCGNNDTYCSYFFNGKVFTTWIDFNSSAWTLEVRLANGSNLGVKKPLQPLLCIPHYKLPEMLGDRVIPTF